MAQHRLGRPGGAAREPGDGRAAAAGDAVHPGGVHPVVLHARRGPGAVRAAVAGGRLLDDRQLPPVQHVRPGPVRLAAEEQGVRPRGDPRARVRGVRPVGRRLPPTLVGSSSPLYLARGGRGAGPRGPATGHGDLPAGGRRAVPVPAEGRRPGRASSRPRRSTQEALRFIARGGRAGQRRDHASATSAIVPPSYPINTVYLWMGGPEESVTRVALKPGAVRIEDLKARLREKLPAHLRQWAAAKWTRRGRAAGRGRGAGGRRSALSFEPADIVNEVMSFGSPTPVEVVVSGPKMADNRAHAAKIHAELAKVPALRDLQYAPGARLPDGRGGDRPREARPRPGRRPADVARSLTAVHVVEPVHRAELLARPGERDRLPGAGRGAARRS